MPQPGADVAQIDTRSLAERTFPGRTPFRIYIAREAHDAIWEHARGAGAEHEVGGVLLGDIYKDETGAFLEIRGSIVAEHTLNEAAQLTFTPETWQRINEVKEERFPDARIVGWYHTHPRFGIFLSDRDSFIQRATFPQPWATAFVVDPVRDLEGFFLWSDGEPRLAQEYWVGLERRDKSYAGAREPREETGEAPERRPLPPASAVSRGSFALASALGFLALLFLFGFVYLREVRHSEVEKYVVGALDVQKAVLAENLNELNALKLSLAEMGERQQAAQAQIRARIQRVENGLQQLGALATHLQQRIEMQQHALDEFVVIRPPRGQAPPAKPEDKQP